MSSENCPFSLTKSIRTEDDRRKERFCKFEVPVDPLDPDGLKSTVEIMKLSSDDPEDILNHIYEFDTLVENTGAGEGAPRFRLFQMTLSSTLSKDWESVRADHPGDNQAAFEECITAFILMKMDHDCAIDTKEWFNQLRKPREWSVKDFMSRFKHLNNLIEYMPLPEPGAVEADRIPKFTDAELRNILKKAGPKEWRESQVRSNLRFDTTIQQVQYYEGP